MTDVDFFVLLVDYFFFMRNINEVRKLLTALIGKPAQ